MVHIGREIQHGLLHVAFGRQLRLPAGSDIDLAGGAGAGPAAIRIDAGDQVLYRAFHQRPAFGHLHRMGRGRCFRYR